MASPGRDRWLWPALIVAAVVAANLPGIVGITDVNPLVTYAGLTRSRGAQLIPGTSTIDINVGATSQALGHRAALDWLAGHVPWWNPFEGVGTPLAAGMQAAAFFPPTLLLAWSGGQLSERLLLEAASGLATYFLLRRLGARPSVACTGGTVFALCGTFAWFQHAAINPVALLPAGLLGVEIAMELDRPLGHVRNLLLPLALVLSITAGFPETAFFDGLLVVAWAVVRATSQPTWEKRARATVRLALLGAGGALLGAPLVLAFGSYLSEGNVGAHSTMAHVHLPPGNLLTLIDPYLTGPLKAFVPAGSAHIENLFITNSGYVLVSGLVLAVAGLLLSRQEVGIRLLLGLWVLVLSLRNFGFLPVEHLLAKVGYVREAAVFRSGVPSIELAVVVLACFGIEAVLSAGTEGSHARRWHVAALAGGGGVLLLTLGFGPARAVMHLVWSGRHYATDPRPYVVGAVAATAAVLAVLAIGGSLRGGRAATACLCGIFVLEAAGSFVYPELAATRSPVVDTRPVTWLASHLGTARLYSLASDPAVGPAYGGPIAPDYGSYYGLSSVDYLDIPDPRLFVDFVHGRLDPGAGSEFFGTVIGRHRHAPSALSELGAHVGAFESIGVKYVVTGALVPLGSYVPAARRVYDDGLVGIWQLPHVTSFFATLHGSCRLRPEGTDAVVAACRGPAVVQRAELALAGWSATVDGRPVRLHPSEHALFSSVDLPAGTSTVVWSYRPGHLLAGELLALAGALMLAAPFAWRLRRTPRRRPAGGAAGGAADERGGGAAGEEAGERAAGLAAEPAAGLTQAPGEAH